MKKKELRREELKMNEPEYRNGNQTQTESVFPEDADPNAGPGDGLPDGVRLTMEQEANDNDKT